jgi:hypothetical protein
MYLKSEEQQLEKYSAANAALWTLVESGNLGRLQEFADQLPSPTFDLQTPTTPSVESKSYFDIVSECFRSRDGDGNHSLLLGAKFGRVDIVTYCEFFYSHITVNF